MRIKFFIFLLFPFGMVFSQNQHDENIQALMEQYAANSNSPLQCEILVQVDVEGMYIPDKTVTVDFSNDKKPIIKGEGLALLPKKGTINQFKEMLSSPLQAIFLSKIDNKFLYKLVSLDENSDWITADIQFDANSNLIYETSINTRKYGAFHTLNSYDNNIYPSKSIITFDVKKFKLPLKFIGRKQTANSAASEDENVLGKITLLYKYI